MNIRKNNFKKVTSALLSLTIAASTVLINLPILPKIEAKADTSYVSDNESSCFYANINVWEDTSKNNLLHTYTKAMGNIQGSTYDDDEDYFVQKMTLKDFTRNLPLYADNKYTASSTFGNYQMSIASELTDFNGNTSNKINAISDSYYIEDEDTADDYTYDTIVKYTTLEKEDAFNACLINFNDTDHSIYKYGIRFKNDEVKALYPDYATYTVTWFEGTTKEQVTGIDDIISISADDLADLTNKKVKISKASGESKEISLITETFFDYEIPNIEGAELTGIQYCLGSSDDNSKNTYMFIYSNGTAFYLGNWVNSNRTGYTAYSDNIDYLNNISILKNFKTTGITNIDPDLTVKYAPNLNTIQDIYSDLSSSGISSSSSSSNISGIFYPCIATEVTLIPNITYESSGSVGGLFSNNYSIEKINITNKHSNAIGHCMAEFCPFLEELNINKLDDTPIHFKEAPVCSCGWGTEDGLIINTNDVIVDATFLYDMCKTNVYDEFPASIEGLTMAVFNGCINTQPYMVLDLSIFNKLSNTFNAITIGEKESYFDTVVYKGTGPLERFKLGVSKPEYLNIYFAKDVKVTEIKDQVTQGNSINIHAYFYNSDGTENEFSRTLLNYENFSKIFTGNYYNLHFEDTMDSLINIESTQVIDRNTSLNDVINKIDKSQITGKIRRAGGITGSMAITTLRADLGNIGTYLGLPGGPDNIYFDNNVTEYTDNNKNKDYFVITGRYYDPVISKLAITPSSSNLSSNPISADFTLLIEKSDNMVSRELESIEIVKPPKKTNYTYGESFDKTGMKVNATYKETYESCRTKMVTDEDVSFDVDKTLLTDDMSYVNVSVTDGVTKTTTQNITVNDVIISSTLENLSIYSHANKTDYKQGETFDRTGLSVDATYKDTYASGKTITRTVPRINYSITDENIPLTDLNKSEMEITFSDNGITKTINEPITVNKYIKSSVLDSIYIEENPNKTEYKYGEKFDDTGMKVNAVYKNTWSDGSITTSEIKDVKYSVDRTTSLTLIDTEKLISYTDDNNVTKTTIIPITVKNYLEKTVLDDINIRKLPDKINYLYGESFDNTGMVVDALYKDIYADGSIINRTVENISVTADKNKLYDTDTDITLSYTDNEITKSKKINVSVKDAIKTILLDNIKITKNPNKLIYTDGESFDDTGMEVNAIYKNIWLSGKETYATSERVAYDIINKDKQLTLIDKMIEASFTDNGVTKTDSINIFVKPALLTSELDSILISQDAAKTEYLYGENFIKNGLVIDAFYKNAWSDGSITYEKRLNVPYAIVDENKNFTLNDYYVVINVTDNGIIKTVKEPILVKDAIAETVLDRIEISSHADKLVYKQGENFDKTGLKVNAVYVDKYLSGKAISRTIENVQYTLSSNLALQPKDINIEIRFTDKNVTKTTKENIQVNSYITKTELDRISVTKMPDKLEYKYGEKADITGLQINAYYTEYWSDGHTTEKEEKNASYDTFDNSKELKLQDNQITISKTDNGIKKEAVIPITVKNYIVKTELHQLNINTQPNKTEYKYGGNF